jgi:hypothetical protein
MFSRTSAGTVSTLCGASAFSGSLAYKTTIMNGNITARDAENAEVTQRKNPKCRT